MKNLFFLNLIIVCVFCLTSCHGQSVGNDQAGTKPQIKKIIGGGCDGCEIMYIGIPKNINATDTSSGWREDGQKLVITGTVYKQDGRTPAPGVIIYYWQTDNKGYYSPSPEMDPLAKRHGHIRGWIKTDNLGKYALYTIRPSPYPDRDIPAHIHPSIKEPGLNEYYIDEFVFDDDKLLTPDKRKKLENRGGSGVLRVIENQDLQIAEHDIILGLNIPDYLEKANPLKQSGLHIGEDSPSFTPFHAWGPDKGSKACPVCKYGRYYGIIYFVGNNPNWQEIETWLQFLEQESVRMGKDLKVYFVYGNNKDYDKTLRIKELESLGKKMNLKNIAITFVSSLNDKESEVNLNKINPDLENTFIVYKNRTIIDKFIDLKPSEENFKLIFEKVKTSGLNAKRAER